jgi:hypothetical protein
MTLYLVQAKINYEGANVIGVFQTEQEAQAVKNNYTGCADEITITPILVGRVYESGQL